MKFYTISARFGHQFAILCFDNARVRSRYQKQHLFCLDCWFPSILVSFAPSWCRGMRFSTISPRFGHQLTTFVFSRLVFAGEIKNSFFFRSWRDEISHHTCAVWSSICNVLFRQCPFTQQISETAYFLSRLLVSVDIGLVYSWVGVAGWDFPPYLRGLLINLRLLFFQGSSLQAISKTVFFSYRLLVSVVIGLVCSWVDVPGWDFPPYLRGLVISLRCFLSTMPVYAADIRNSIFFV